MSFSAKVSVWANKTAPETLVRQRREMLLRLFGAVVMDTPVLEGTLRGNWRCSADNPLPTVIEYRTQNEVMQEIDSILSGSRMEQDIYLRNNLPYAYPIEYYGHSKIKAPQGMVRKNVRRFQQIARSVTGNI